MLKMLLQLILPCSESLVLHICFCVRAGLAEKETLKLMKTPYSSHCYRLAVLFLLVTFAVCSWTRQFCDSSCSSGGSCSDCKGGPTFQLGREVLRQTAVIQDSQWCFPGVSQPLLDPLPRGKQMKKKGFPCQIPLWIPRAAPTAS